jgi:hypothetical protein
MVFLYNAVMDWWGLELIGLIEDLLVVGKENIANFMQGGDNAQPK